MISEEKMDELCYGFFKECEKAGLTVAEVSRIPAHLRWLINTSIKVDARAFGNAIDYIRK